MSRMSRLPLAAAAVLLGLLALHIHLNHGGLARVVKRLGSGAHVRGELAVGFLPVT